MNLVTLKDSRVLKPGVRVNCQGFTLIEIVIVVFVLGVLLAIGVPNFVQARLQTHKNLCINNLRIIEAAKEQWALTNRKAEGEPVNESEVNTFLRAGPALCPAGGHYTYGNVGETPRCSLAEIYGHVLTDPDLQQDPQGEDEEEPEGGKGRGKGKGKGHGRDGR